MEKENLYEPFSISVEELDDYLKRNHQHTFFELVYILSGTGKQCINKSKFSYSAGHMFLITPQDCHSFEIDTTTQFFFLKFNNIYIKSNIIQTDNVKRLEFILQNANHQPGCILKNFKDKALVRPIIDAIIREYVNHDLFNKELIQQLINTLIIVVARNIIMHIPDQINDSTDEKAVKIIQYIHNNIHCPQKIKTETIGEHVGISKNYLGRFFKNHTNEGLQDYINGYKMRLIENRLLHSVMRIAEIADELGFVDESHLNKFFKKQNGLSLSAFRKKNKTSK